MYEVRIEVNPERAGETVPLIPDTDMTPLSSLNNNQTSNTTKTTSDNVNTEPVEAEPVNVEPVEAEVVEAEPVVTDTSSCSSCGAKLNPEDKFCVECGTKVE